MEYHPEADLATINRNPMMTATTEHALVTRCKAGDHTAFAELVERNLPTVRRAVRTVAANPDDLEDILQDALLKAYKCIAGFHEQCRFSTWLTRIAINQALMLLRRRKRQLEVSLEVETEEGDTLTLQLIDARVDPEQALIREQTVTIVREAVGLLPAHLRQYTRRRWFDECPHKEVASSLGITTAAGKARSLRARRRLNSSLARTFGQSA